jgi:hypothetical protein
MAEDKRDRELDASLDSMLADYSAAEPRPGLEIRLRAGLRAHAARRRRTWVMACAAAAAVVLVVAIAGLRSSRPIAPHNDVPSIASQPPSVFVATPVPRPQRVKATPRSTPERPAVSENRSQLLLQTINVMPSADNLVFEHEKSYLALAPQREPEPAPPSATSAPGISIQDLGVPSIEIKELPSGNSNDSKGTL